MPDQEKPTGSSYQTMVDAELDHAQRHAECMKADASRIDAKASRIRAQAFLLGVASFWATVTPPAALIVWLVVR